MRKQEVVIGGWLPGKGRRGGRIGALLCGYYEGEGEDRRLRYEIVEDAGGESTTGR